MGLKIGKIKDKSPQPQLFSYHPYNERDYRQTIEDMIRGYIFLDFTKNKLFHDVSLGEEDGEIILEGDIINFQYRLPDIFWAPVLAIYTLTLFPLGRAVTEIELNIKLRCKNTNDLIAEYTVKGYKKRWFSVWWRLWEASYDYQVPESLKEVVEDLKEKIYLDKEKIVSSCKR